MTQDWKSTWIRIKRYIESRKGNWVILVPIIAAVITLGGAYTTIIVSSLLRPDIEVDLKIPETATNKNEGSISVINEGSAPAKNLKLTVEYPHKITDLNIFRTENYSDTNSSQVLEIYVPRFAQGKGSLVKIASTMDSNITENDKYKIYLTHDQGSTLELLSESQLSSRFSFDIQPWITSPYFITLVIGIIAGFSAYFYTRRREKPNRDMEK